VGHPPNCEILWIAITSSNNTSKGATQIDGHPGLSWELWKEKNSHISKKLASTSSLILSRIKEEAHELAFVGKKT
jgi:hypothetical protein